MPNADHGAGSPAPAGYNDRRLRNFFAKNLQGIDPPNYNQTPASPPGQGGRRGRGALGAVQPVMNHGAAQAASPYVATGLQQEQQTQDTIETALPVTAAQAEQQQPAAAQPLVLTGLESKATRTSRIVSRYQADRRSLTGFYLDGNSPSTRKRMRQFDVDWIAALTALPTSTFSAAEKDEITELKAQITDDFATLEEASRADARLDPLLPFADTIHQLMAERLEVKPMDAESAALRLDAIVAKVNEAKATFETRVQDGNGQNGAANLTAADVNRAAAQVTSLRQLLGRWHGFYESYDPLFTWWMKTQFPETTKALDSYAAFLKEQAGKMDTAAAAAGSPQATTADAATVASLPTSSKPASDVPDLRKLLDDKPGYMTLVIQKYQQETGRGGRGGRGGGRGGRRGGADTGGDRGADQAERSAQNGDATQNVAGAQDEVGPPARQGRRGGDNAVVQNDGQENGQAEEGPGQGGRRGGRGGGFGRGRGGAGGETREQIAARAKRWLAALAQLDFNSFTRSDKVDYYLLQQQLQQQLAGGAGGGGGGRGGRGEREDRDGSGILVLPPVGRDALMADLQREMIDYTPEQLIEIGNREMKVCRAEMLKATREMGLGDDWQAAVEKVKNMHVPPGEQPQMIHRVAWEAIDFLNANNLITIPPIAAEVWGMQMMSPERQLVNPFFTGGAAISVSYPTDTMSTEAKLQSMRGNNIPFARATAFHELIPGHNLQQYMAPRYNTQRRGFGSTPFWGEGWALYWELMMYEKGFTKKPEDRVGALVWRSHRCARIVFSLSYQMGQMTPKECVDYLVANVGFDRLNAEGEVRRSFEGGYGPLYQAAYLLGGIQLRSLHKEVVDTGKMTDRDFHDAIIEGGSMPIKLVRVLTTDVPCTHDGPPEWKFYDDVNVPGAAAVSGTP